MLKRAQVQEALVSGQGRKWDARLREYDFPVEPISREERRALAFGLMEQIHTRRLAAGIAQVRMAELADLSQSVLSTGYRQNNINRLDVVCAMAYTVGLKLKLVPWDDTSS